MQLPGSLIKRLLLQSSTTIWLLPGNVMGKAVQFGCFELDLADNTLRKSGRRVHLQSQPLKVLGALVEASGNIVTRAQLKALVWPSDTFVDFDKSLNTAIMKIRHALGDSAQSPRYLETVPRLGYRFLAPVTNLNTPVIHRREQRASRSGLLLTACLVTAVMLAASYFVSAFRSQTRQAYLPSVPLTTFAGSEIVPSFSPDGEKIVFAWDGEGQHNFDIYTKEIASGRLNRLTDDPHDDLSPTWSPDGRSIAYIRVLSGTEAEILVAPAQDVTRTRRLATLAAPIPYYARFKMLAWSPDSRNLVYTESQEVGSTQSLYLLDVVTGRAGASPGLHQTSTICRPRSRMTGLAWGLSATVAGPAATSMSCHCPEPWSQVRRCERRRSNAWSAHRLGRETMTHWSLPDMTCQEFLASGVCRRAPGPSLTRFQSRRKQVCRWMFHGTEPGWFTLGSQSLRISGRRSYTTSSKHDRSIAGPVPV